MRNKGFIHVVEAIIVILILLLTLSQFFFLKDKETNFESFSLMRYGRDVLNTIEKTYDHNIIFDAGKLRNATDDIIPANSRYSYKVTGVVPPTIRVACNCTQEERELVVRTLSDLKFNNRTVKFVVNHIVELHNISLYDDVDALVIWGYQNLSNSTTLSEVAKFLQRDKGVVEISSFATITTLEPEHNSIYGVSRQPGTPSSGQGVNFTNTRNKELSNYKIYDYFNNIPLHVPVDSPQGGNPFGLACHTGFLGEITLRNEKMKTLTCNSTESNTYDQVYIDLDQDEILENGENFTVGSSFGFDDYFFQIKKIENVSFNFDIPQNYTFLNFAGENVSVSSSAKSLLIGANDNAPNAVVNDRITVSKLKGRSVWISDSGEHSDFGHLVKSAVIWSTGSTYEPVPPIDQRPGALGSDVYINFAGDLYELAKVTIVLWFVF